ncbi:MAG TPA: orotidine-5'-phosphate decarboxylase [Gammaproteobacteria bacterium]|jgi:uridine monophosphate synthetase|nr:orotidine-5'-phosphate decarboxylase [Gammaproteobacteria bacterium]
MQNLAYAARAQLCKSPIAKRLLLLLDEKKTNLSLSADVTSAEQLLALADEMGPEIAVLKTHIDIIDDFTPALTARLRQLADKHRFLLFEDRKFADIGNTVKSQYAGGVYRIVSWADLINAHCLPGPGIIQGLAEAASGYQRGLILLAEMSSAGHLMNKDYVAQTLKMAEQAGDFVIGFITQHALSDNPCWINFTPGVKLGQGGDTLGQQYVTPETAILAQGTDVIIVGRGIISANNPLQEARVYRAAGWEAYQRRITLSIKI